MYSPVYADLQYVYIHNITINTTDDHDNADMNTTTNQNTHTSDKYIERERET